MEIVIKVFELSFSQTRPAERDPERFTFLECSSLAEPFELFELFVGYRLSSYPNIR